MQSAISCERDLAAELVSPAVEVAISREIVPGCDAAEEATAAVEGEVEVEEEGEEVVEEGEEVVEEEGEDPSPLPAAEVEVGP